MSRGACSRASSRGRRGFWSRNARGGGSRRAGGGWDNAGQAFGHTSRGAAPATRGIGARRPPARPPGARKHYSRCMPSRAGRARRGAPESARRCKQGRQRSVLAGAHGRGASAASAAGRAAGAPVRTAAAGRGAPGPAAGARTPTQAKGRSSAQLVSTHRHTAGRATSAPPGRAARDGAAPPGRAARDGAARGWGAHAQHSRVGAAQHCIDLPGCLAYIRRGGRPRAAPAGRVPAQQGGARPRRRSGGAPPWRGRLGQGWFNKGRRGQGPGGRHTRIDMTPSTAPLNSRPRLLPSTLAVLKSSRRLMTRRASLCVWGVGAGVGGQGRAWGW
jgi:hypothetical protein